MASLSVMTTNGSIKTIDLDGLNNYVPQKGEVIMFDGRVEDYNFEVVGSDLILTLPNGEELVLTGMADMLSKQDEENPTKVTIASGDEGDILVLDNFATLTEIMEAAAAGNEAELQSNSYYANNTLADNELDENISNLDDSQTTERRTFDNSLDFRNSNLASQTTQDVDTNNSNTLLNETDTLSSITNTTSSSSDTSSQNVQDDTSNTSNSSIQSNVIEENNDSTIQSEEESLNNSNQNSTTEESTQDSENQDSTSNQNALNNSDEAVESASDEEESQGNENEDNTQDDSSNDDNTVIPSAPIITNMTDTNGDMSEIILSGTADGIGNIITVYDKDGNTIGTTSVQSNGTWSLDVASLENNKDYTLSATQTDSNGNESANSNSVNTYQSDYSGTYAFSSDDYLFTGTGDDKVRVNKDDSNDSLVIDTGDGIDRVEFSSQTEDITVNLGDNQAENIGDDLVELRNVEDIYGGQGNDTLIGDSGSNLLYGDAGNDIIEGGAGEDYLYGGSGDDTIDGGSENDILAGGDGNDILKGGAGDDSLHGQNGDDTIIGGAGNDTIRADWGTDTVGFSGNLEDYSITYNSSTKHIIVEDTRPNSPDGTDDLYMVEYIQFADQVVSTAIPETPSVDLVTSSDTGASNTDNITSDTTPTFQVSLGTSVSVGYVVTLSAGANKFEYTVTSGDIENGYVQITTDELSSGDYEVSATITSLLGFDSESSSTLDMSIYEEDTQASYISIDMDISEAISSVSISGDSLNLNGYNTTNLGDISQNTTIDESNNATNGKDYIIVNDISGGVNIKSGNGKDLLQINGDINGNASYDGGNGKDTLVLGKSEDSYTINNYTNNNGVISAQIVDNDTGETLTVNNIESIRFTDTTYEYNLTINTQISDNDGSETISNISLNNLPQNVILKDSNGDEILANEDGSYTVSNGLENVVVTIQSPELIDSDSLNSITSTATSVESNSGDELTVQSNIEGYDSLFVEEDTSISFSELKDMGVDQLDEINISGGNGTVIDGIEIEDVLAITQTNSNDEQIMKIVGDSSDEVKLDTSKWEKSTEIVTDEDGHQFNVYQGSNDSVKLYIENDVVVTDI